MFIYKRGLPKSTFICKSNLIYIVRLSPRPRPFNFEEMNHDGIDTTDDPR
jgi:hypothetical protein